MRRPRVLVIYTNALFAEGLMRLLTGRTDCTICGILPLTTLTPDHLAQTSSTVTILEGDESDPQVLAAMRLLLGQRTAVALIRVDLAAPILRVYRADDPVPAGLEELARAVRELADQPLPLTDRRRPLETHP